MTADDELAALRQRVEELEARVPKPPAPFVPADPRPRRDLTEGMGMPPSAIAAMVEAVPDGLMREVARDRHASVPCSALAEADRPKPSASGGGGGSGWREATPLGPVPGIGLVDRLCEVADARERAELITKEANRRLVEKKATQSSRKAIEVAEEELAKAKAERDQERHRAVAELVNHQAIEHGYAQRQLEALASRRWDPTGNWGSPNYKSHLND